MEKIEQLKKQFETKHNISFEVAMNYLESVRKSGKINMYESPLLVRKHLNVDIVEAKEIVSFWMQNYHDLSEYFG